MRWSHTGNDAPGCEEIKVRGGNGLARRKGQGKFPDTEVGNSSKQQEKPVRNIYLFIVCCVPTSPVRARPPQVGRGQRFPCPSGIWEHTRWELAEAAGTDAHPEGKLQK